jgi:hypothetical protein
LASEAAGVDASAPRVALDGRDDAFAVHTD